LLESSKVSLASTEKIVALRQSTWPIALGTPVVTAWSSITRAQYFLNSSEVNAVPRSDIIWAGFPNVALWASSLVMSLEDVDFVGYSQQNLVKPSMTEKICLHVTAPVATGEPRFSLKAYYTGSCSMHLYRISTVPRVLETNTL